MVVTSSVVDLELELDAPKERRGRVKDDPIDSGLERPLEEVGDPTVIVRALLGKAFVAVEELDPHAAGRLAALRVQDVRGNRRLHGHGERPL